MSWIDKYMENLAKHEGKSSAKAIEGGGYTRGYGLTDLAQGFLQTKGAEAEDVSDEQLAREYVLWNAEQIKKSFPNFESWPDSVKVAAVDLAYNGGNINNFKGFSNALKENNWQEAAKQTLDIISANDPKTGQKAVLRGLANRRVDYYNKIALDIGFPTINTFDIAEEGSGSKVSYKTDSGDLDFNFKGKLHSASGSYDVKKNLTDDIFSLAVQETYKQSQDYLDPSKEVFHGYDSELQDPSPSPNHPLKDIATFFLQDEPEKYLTMEDAMELPDYDELVAQQQMSSIADTFFVEGSKIPKSYYEEQERLRQEKATVDGILADREARGYDYFTGKEPELQKLFEFRDRQRYGEQYFNADPDLYEISSFQPGPLDTLIKSFRQYSPVMATGRVMEKLIQGRNPFSTKPEDGYSVYTSPLAKKLLTPEGMHYYENSLNDEDLLKRYNRKMRDLQDLEDIEKSRSGTGSAAFFATAGPTIFAPIAPIKIMKYHNAGRRFAGGAAFGLVVAGGQQTAIMTQNEARDSEEAAGALLAIALVNGSLTAAFGKNIVANAARLRENERLLTEQQKISAFGRHQARMEAREKGLDPDFVTASAGAAVAPELERVLAYQQIEREALEETGINLEKLDVNPVNRLAKSPNPIIRAIAPELVDMGGVMQKKIRAGEEAMAQSVEKEMSVKYMPLLRKAVVNQDRQYALYRGSVPSGGDVRLQVQSAYRAGKDIIFGVPDGMLTPFQFRERVGKAMIRGDVDRVGDAASPFVTASAKEYRKLFEVINKEGTAVGIFSTELQAELKAARDVGDMQRVTEIQIALNQLRQTGPLVNTAASYLPRIGRVDKIDANPSRFIKKTSDWLRKNRGLSTKEARGVALEIMDLYTKRKPFLDYENTSDAFDFIKKPSGAMRRSLEIPDRVIEEFLEKDIEAIAKYHVKTMGTDIELTRKFGEISMDSTLKQATDEYMRLINATNDLELRKSLNEAMKRDLDDVKALRDRLRGTYGASKDPHAMGSRFVRAMKSINVLTGMAGATLSSVPDLARPAMVEGLQPVMKAMGVLFSEAGTRFAKMTKIELQESAVAVDAALGLRAHAMMDVGDVFGNRYGVERSLNAATGAMFFINGLNIWNQVLKEIAGNVTILRMTNAIMRKAGWDGLSQSDKEKLLKNGISKHDYGIMRDQIKRFGQKEQGRWLPNTADWTDSRMRIKFRIALNQNVDRIIITPGAGDRALWTSTEVGSLITQFKSFGQGAFVRMLQSGMQEKDGAFWQGAIMIIALAGIVNEIKRAQYGLPREEDPKQLLIDAIDRSGITGFFADFNNVAEVLSSHQIGLRPLFGQEPYTSGTASIANATLGPTGSFAVNASSVLGDVVSGNIDEGTAKAGRFITPAGNHPALDPLLDDIFGQGNVNRQD